MVLIKQPNKYEIGDEATGIDKNIITWCEHNFEREKYNIYSDGFLINTYYIVFVNPEDEARFVLEWR